MERRQVKEKLKEKEGKKTYELERNPSIMLEKDIYRAIQKWFSIFIHIDAWNHSYINQVVFPKTLKLHLVNTIILGELLINKAKTILVSSKMAFHECGFRPASNKE